MIQGAGPVPFGTGPVPYLEVEPVDIASAWARVPDEVKADAWRLVKAGFALEANRVLVLAVGDALEAQGLVAWLVRRKLGIHN